VLHSLGMEYVNSFAVVCVSADQLSRISFVVIVQVILG